MDEAQEPKNGDGTPAEPEEKKESLFEDLKKALPHPKKRAKAIRGLISKTVKKLAHERMQQPGWETKTLIACLGNQLAKLKDLIEDPEEKEVSWEHPWVETQYPVLLKGIRKGDTLRWGEKDTRVHPLIWHYPTEADVDITTEEGAEWMIVSALHQVEYELFEKLTRHLAWLKKGDEISHIIPEAIHKDLGLQMGKAQEGFTEEQRARHTELTEEILFQPFTLWLGKWGENDEAYPPDGSDPITDACFNHIPHMGISGTDNSGREFSVSLILEIHPLLIEVDEDGTFLRAYYPVLAGLRFWPDDLNPSRWPAEDREKKLWESIDQLFTDLVEQMEAEQKPAGGEPEEPESETPGKEETPATTAQAAVMVAEESAVPVAGPPRTIFPQFLSTGARVDRQVAEVINHAHHVKLPARWSKIQRWEDLEQKEIQEFLEEEEERAFDDLRQITGNPDARGPLLAHRYKASGAKEIVLTAEAKRDLRRREGQRGFIETDGGKEYYVRLYETGKRGPLEIGLSWAGLAGPLVAEWRKQKLEEAERRRDTPLLWDQLDEGERHRVDQMVEQASLFNVGPDAMDAIVFQVSVQGTNPIYFHAESLRALMWPDRRQKNLPPPANWKQKVKGLLETLRALEWKWSAPGGKGYGSFLGSWNYIGRGPGGHGDGVYILDVQPEFLGCIQVFSNGKKLLRNGRDALYFDFRKKLSKEEKGEITGYITFDAGRPFYNAAAGLTSSQKKLAHFLEENLTRKGDPACKENHHRKDKGKDRRYEYRTYDRAFCPLLPEGGIYYGALGHFPKNPEYGFTLGGTGSRLSRHTEGLMSVMEYILPLGRSTSRKGRIISEALGDLKAVVVETYGGIVAGRLGDEWLPLERFKELDEEKLCYKLRIYCFIPENFQRARREKWEEQTNYQAPRTLEEAEMAAWGDLDGMIPNQDKTLPTADNAFQGLPLRERLQEVMKRRNVSGAGLAALFGVTKMTVSYWLTGKKPIPEDSVPLLVRWIESGTAPTAEELAARRSRKSGK